MVWKLPNYFTAELYQKSMLKFIGVTEKIKNTIIAHSVSKLYDVSIGHKQNEIHAFDIL